MNAPLRNTEPDPQLRVATPSGASGAAGLPRAVWIGGGLMGLTIVALAVALVGRSGSPAASPDSTGAPVVAALPATTAPVQVAQATPPGTPAPVVTEAPDTPVAKPAAHTAPAHSTHSTTSHAATPATGTAAQNNGGAQVATPDAPTAAGPAPAPAKPVAVCSNCGVVESVTPVKQEGQGSGVGAVAGGALGAVAGSQIAGRNHKTLGAVIGAVGGGLLGNTVEKHSKTTTVYSVGVRMADGSLRTVQYGSAPHPGDKVTVEGNTLKLVAGTTPPQGTAPAPQPQ